MREPVVPGNVVVDLGGGPFRFGIEGYWDDITGTSWVDSVYLCPVVWPYYWRRTHAANYSGELPDDNEVLYGSTSWTWMLVHVSEVVQWYVTM